jgi:hypothetical protein
MVERGDALSVSKCIAPPYYIDSQIRLPLSLTLPFDTLRTSDNYVEKHWPKQLTDL